MNDHKVNDTSESESGAGRIALVTGANKGIGYETARLLGEQGWTTLLGARDRDRGARAAETLQGKGIDARFVALDVTSEDSARTAAEYVEREFGRLDVLVNNAGITGGGGFGMTPTRTTQAALRAAFETNVFGVVTVTNAMIPLLRKGFSPRVVNVSSEVGSIAMTMDPDGPMWKMAGIPYPVSKTALNMVTAQYAKELWDTGIKVNAANPGYCATDLNGNSGFRTPEQGAEVSVHLATLGDDGPSGVLWGYLWRPGADSSPGAEAYGILPW